MKTPDIWLFKRSHHGIVLDVAPHGFDSGSATFGSVFITEDDPKTFFLFYTGAQDIFWSHAAIGLATSKNGLKFRRISKHPILEGSPESFCYKEAITPAVTQVKNRFYMVFSGKPSPESFRRLGIAYADDPRGSWHILGELIKPTYLWEGLDIDNGPSIVKLDDETFLVFYSSVTSTKKWDIFARVRRYPIRRIGIVKVRVRGASMSKIETYKSPSNPLKHLNGPKGSWNESVFCPGYIQLHTMHYLFPAASTYSTGPPYRQYIGIAANDSPYFHKPISKFEKLIDGPSEKALIIPEIKSEIKLDSPTPLLKRGDKDKLFLYYSVADSVHEMWKIALTIFGLKKIGQ